MGVIRFRAAAAPRLSRCGGARRDAGGGGGGRRQTVPGRRNRHRRHLADQRGPHGDEFLADLNREVRDGAGVPADDEAEVIIEPGQASREAGVPEALAVALAADPQAAASFGRMAVTHRREYARWISEGQAR
jgi:hypothetical protein